MSCSRLNFVRVALTGAVLSTLVSCSSAPKIPKDPAEEQALQTQAQAVIAAGPTASAKAGGYDAIPFWQNRPSVTKKLTSMREAHILAASRKAYIVDFKVTFRMHDTGHLGGGLGLGDKLSDIGQNYSGGSTRTMSVKENKWVHTFTEKDPATFQKITDALYKDFSARLQAAGYQVQTREAVTYDDMKEYLASSSMLPSPQDGSENAWIFAPTGWTLEKSTMDGIGLGAAFGTTLMKLGEQNSRKVDESVAFGVSYDVDLGSIVNGQYAPTVRVKGDLATATTYYNGAIALDDYLKDATAYPFTAKLTDQNDGTTGRAISTVAALMTNKSQEYSTSETYTMSPKWDVLENRVLEHGGYVNDLLFERVRQARDD